MPARGELDDFEPEHLVAYEAGGKSRLLHGRLTLNAAAFYYDFEDLQVSTITLEVMQRRSTWPMPRKPRSTASMPTVSPEISDRLTVSGGIIWTPMREFVEFTDDQ